MSDRSIRNLANLQAFGSTSRVLNLLAVWRRHGRTDEWRDKPLFQTPALNRGLIIKHRLRRDEVDLFHGYRQSATKVILPLDLDDLRLGGRFIFIGQRNFDRALREYFGVSVDERDLETLRLIDQLPSLDPFLLREQIKRAGLDVARCYFELTEGDMKRMFSFVEDQIAPLVAMSMTSEASPGQARATANLVSKILSSTDGAGMQPLGDTLQLAPEQYAEGVFCWKGFLYYKWSAATVLKEARAVADAIATIQPAGPLDAESRLYVERGRHVLRPRILKTCDTVIQTLKVYDRAYASLTRDARPTAFREFLLDAPHMFIRLGEQVGAVRHIVSFWNFRFAPGAPRVSVEELIDIFMDFETSLASRDGPA
ncbi:MAG: hypothetical protein ACK4FB_09775 [Brevundimonas sp.]|uniref:hypothetical protein n=1 Tax=Brevundimonas sp. TaxID=1871086 RepID=UPI003919A257